MAQVARSEEVCMKKVVAGFLSLALAMLLGVSAFAQEGVPGWREGSLALDSILSYVESVTKEDSPDYVPPAKRVAVFDVDGTIYGELFPTYLDDCILIERLAHDETYEAPEEDREYALALEEALLKGEEEPPSPRSGAQMSAEAFAGFTLEEFRAYVRSYLERPVLGFEGMTYGEGFYEPMVHLIEALSDQGFLCFLVSGTQTDILRELIQGTLDEVIAPYQVIGSTYALLATGQGETAGRSYTYGPEDQVVLGPNLVMKNVKMNKVVSIVETIGIDPVLCFGNSSGDFAMAQYTQQKGGKAFMLLCDDTERDNGKPEVAKAFAEECESLGFETISMRDDFETIYGADVRKADLEALEPAA